MKYILNLVSVIIILMSMPACDNIRARTEQSTAETNQVSTEGPEIKFQKEVHDFGKIINGERVSTAFTFTNTGNSPLLISAVRSGCGCTVGDYPKEPVLPNEKGKIDVVFNSAGKRGYQVETIRVFTNTEPSVFTLKIQAEVAER